MWLIEKQKTNAFVYGEMSRWQRTQYLWMNSCNRARGEDTVTPREEGKKMTVLTSVFGHVDREQKCDSFDMSELTCFSRCWRSPTPRRWNRRSNNFSAASGSPIVDFSNILFPNYLQLWENSRDTNLNSDQRRVIVAILALVQAFYSPIVSSCGRIPETLILILTNEDLQLLLWFKLSISQLSPVVRGFQSWRKLMDSFLKTRWWHHLCCRNLLLEENSLLQNSFCWTGGEVQAETQGLRGRVGQGDCLMQAGVL